MNGGAIDDFDVIETPENVHLQRRLAGIGSRFIAGLVDTLLILGIYLLLLIAFVVIWSVESLGYFGWENGPELWAMALLIVFAFTVYWGYFVFFELLTNGQSPGKRQQRIRVVKDEGGAITFMDVAVRNLLRPVDGFAFYGVAGLCMFVTRRGQRLGDLAAGTVVVCEQTREWSARTDKKKERLWEPEPGTADLRASGLSLQEHRMLSSYRLRREQLTLEARQRLLPQLLKPILQRAGRTPEEEPFEALESYVDSLLDKGEDRRSDEIRQGETNS